VIKALLKVLRRLPQVALAWVREKRNPKPNRLADLCTGDVFRLPAPAVVTCDNGHEYVGRVMIFDGGGFKPTTACPECGTPLAKAYEYFPPPRPRHE
jgi:hypothetical protein